MFDPSDAEHANLRVLDHPLIRQKLTKLRDRNTPAESFRRLLSETAGLMLYEILRDVPTVEREVRTPLAVTTGSMLAHPVTLVAVLRAGLGMVDGMLRLMPDARVGPFGLYRDESRLEPVRYYTKFPKDMADGPVVLVDPMLATGGSACHSAEHLRSMGCSDLRMACLVCAPEGVERMAREHPDVTIYTAVMDDHLDERGFIVPGLGDAGDRMFGTESE